MSGNIENTELDELTYIMEDFEDFDQIIGELHSNKTVSNSYLRHEIKNLVAR